MKSTKERPHLAQHNDDGCRVPSSFDPRLDVVARHDRANPSRHCKDDACAARALLVRCLRNASIDSTGILHYISMIRL